MLKGAGKHQLRAWYEHIIVPVVSGDWDPAQAVKEAEMILIDKGKGDVSSLDFFRGIGLLQHAYKIMEWALMAGVWREIIRVLDEEVMGFIPNRTGIQALWRARAENDRRRREGKPWVWLSMDVKKAFDTIVREVGLAAAEGLGIGRDWVQPASGP